MTYTNNRRKDGLMSMHGFSCGYIEEYGQGWLDGGVGLYADGCWHVRGSDNGVRQVWECFDTLTDARRFARSLFPVIRLFGE